MKKIIIMMISWPLWAINSNTLLSLDSSQQIIIFLGFLSISIGILSSGYALSISLGAYTACTKEYKNFALMPALMPASKGIYSFAISFLMIENMYTMPLQSSLAGVMCGLPCLYSAIGQAKTAACCIKEISNAHMHLGQALIVTAITEIYALLGLILACLIMI